jgi:Ca2+-binding EF-hand superfamily protein
MIAMKEILAASVLACALAGGAVAQQSQQGPTADECRAMFSAADTNKDGVLSKAELAASEALASFYAPEENADNVSLNTFIGDCSG